MLPFSGRRIPAWIMKSCGSQCSQHLLHSFWMNQSGPGFMCSVAKIYPGSVAQGRELFSELWGADCHDSSACLC